MGSNHGSFCQSSGWYYQIINNNVKYYNLNTIIVILIIKFKFNIRYNQLKMQLIV